MKILKVYDKTNRNIFQKDPKSGNIIIRVFIKKNILNEKPIVEILKEINLGEHLIWEPFFIKKFKQEGFKLVNDDENGLGTIGGKNIKTLKKLQNQSKIKINQYDINGDFIQSFDSLREAEKKLNINHGNISKCCSGIYNHAGGFIFKKNSDTNKPKKLKIINAKPKKVLEIDLNDNIINEYNSISEASKITNIDAGNISKVCNNKLKKTKNRKFKFKK